MATYISSGTYYVSSGTSLNEPVVTKTGRLEVLSGGTTTNAKVSSGGTAIVTGLDESGTYGSGGRLYINRGGACASMTATGAVIYVSGGRIILGGTISGGSMSAAGSGSNTATLNGITMYDSAWVYVSDGAVASNTVISSGVLRVYSGGLARSTTVHNGTLQVWSGASASSTAVSSGGKLSVDFTATATGNKVYSRGVMTVSGTANYNTIYGQMNVISGGYVSSSIIYTGGAVYLDKNGRALMTTVSGGRLILSGGFAEITTVSSGGEMHVSGGSADGVDVFSGAMSVFNGTVSSANIEGGSAVIYGGGVLTRATLTSLGIVYVTSGGSVNNAVISSGYITVLDGGMIQNTTVNNGSYNYIKLSGGSASLTKLGNQTKMHVSSGGTATDTTVSKGGSMMVYDRGTVIGGTIDDGGSMYISSGGTATGVTLKGAAWLSVMEDARASGTTVSGGHINVQQDGKVIGAAIGSGSGITGELEIRDGGSAAGATINAGGSLFVSDGGKATDIVENGGYVNYGDTATVTFASNTFSGAVGSATVHSRTTATDVTVNGYLRVYGGRTYNVTVVGALGMGVVKGGTATDTTVQSHSQLNVLDGTVNGVSVLSGGDLYVSSGGKLTGKLSIEAGALVSAYDGSTLDFDLTQTTAGANALVNDFSLIKGAPLYTLTVSGTQASGTYKLAGGAAGFNKTISVVNTEGSSLGTLTVGQTATIGGVDYTLNLGGDNLLSVTVVGSGPEPVTALPFFTGDFNGDLFDTLAVQKDSTVTIYQNGEPWGIGLSLDPGWTVVGTGDFNGDHLDDFLRVNTEGYVVGEMSNGNGTFTPQVLNLKNAGWDILGTGDFNGNGTSDVLIANPTGASEAVGLLGYWESGVSWTLINGYSPEWECVSTGDFNGDGKCDMLWRNSFEGEGGLTYNAYCTWIVDNPVDWRMVSVANPDEWNFLCSGDFDGNGSHDIAMINDVGVVGIWGVTDGYLSSWSILSAVTSEWQLAGVADFNADGTDDIAWSNTGTGLTGYWQINDKQLTTWQNIAVIG